MQYDFIYSLNVTATYFSLFTMMAMVLAGFLLNGQVSRLSAVVIGLGFIGIGLAGYLHMQDTSAHALTQFNHKLISEATLASFNRYKDIGMYVLPLISAYIGTNIISDALVKHQKYEEGFSIRFALMVVSQSAGFVLAMVAFALVAIPWMTLEFAGLAAQQLERSFGKYWPRLCRLLVVKALMAAILSRHYMNLIAGFLQQRFTRLRHTEQK